MKKTSIIFLLCLFAFNPLVLFADESKVNSDLAVQVETDSFDTAPTFISHPVVYMKSFKVINKNNNALIIQKVETKSGFDNKKGYKDLRTPYLDIIADDIFFPLFLPKLPFDLVITPCSNLYKLQQLMSINKYQRGKYKLKPHKSINIVIAPVGWNCGQSDELTISYKKSKSSSEIETFKYQFKYSEQKHMNYKSVVRTSPSEKDCTKH